jgi:RimJ/RimL family protein N-acetyltransferase
VIEIQSERLALSRLDPDDDAHAAFILELLNEEGWLRHIGDRGVRSLADARQYVRNGPASSYLQHGFGLFLVERRADRELVGICGLLRRETLPDVDVGFAILQRHSGQGYAREAAAATLAWARDRFGFDRVVAITALDNFASARVLERIGMQFETNVRLGGVGDELRLFAWNAPSSRSSGPSESSR